MEEGLPRRHAKIPHITVVVSGITPELSETNGEDGDLPAPEDEGGQVAEPGGLIVHKNAAGIFSRRVIALENRMERIEREIRSLKVQFNGRLTRIEDKLKELLKGQQKILNKLEELEHARPIVLKPDNGLSREQPSSTTLKRKRAEKSSGRRPVTLNSSAKPSFVKYYARMRAKQAAPDLPLLATIDSAANGLGFADIGSSSGAMPSEP